MLKINNLKNFLMEKFVSRQIKIVNPLTGHGLAVLLPQIPCGNGVKSRS